MTNNKTELVAAYLMPAFNVVAENNKELFTDLCKVCRLHQTVKYQMLEMPDADEEGRLWFAIDALVHAYHYCPVKKCKWGSRIWKRQEFIVYSASLEHQQPRTDYIEVLEPGRVLSIGYADLNDLMVRYPVLALQLRHIAIANERYYAHRNRLLKLPAVQRIELFKEENGLFMQLASQAVVAAHLGMSLRGYSAYC